LVRFQQEADRLSLNTTLTAEEKLRLLKDKYSIGKRERAPAIKNIVVELEPGFFWMELSPQSWEPEATEVIEITNFCC